MCDTQYISCARVLAIICTSSTHTHSVDHYILLHCTININNMEVFVHMQSCHRCVVSFFMCSCDVTVSTRTKTHVDTQIHAPMTFLFPGMVNMFLDWIRTKDNNTSMYVYIYIWFSVWMCLFEKTRACVHAHAHTHTHSHIGTDLTKYPPPPN